MFLVILTTLLSNTYAQQQGIEIGAPFPGEPKNVTLIQHIGYVLGWAYTIGALLAVAMIIIGGFKYITSGGNPQVLQDAKDTVVGALIGLAFLLLIALLTKSLGLDINIASP